MNTIHWLVFVLSFSLSALKINCQSDWHGRWFPYDPSHGPDITVPVAETDKNCDDDATGPDCSNTTTNKDDWNGKWFPEGKEDHNNIVMGQPFTECDDGETNLDVDYDGNPLNYTCYNNKTPFLPNPSVHPLHEIEQGPKSYMSKHVCMKHKITYVTKFPTFGPHRPNWPKYGEYPFVPIQRWLHTLEHGGIVMLYHPCANKNQVEHLKHIVKDCLFKHVISANSDLTSERPMALLSFGHRLFMSKVDDDVAIKFIREHAGRGPEDTTRDGLYTFLLKKPAKLVSGEKDHNFCPSQNIHKL